MDTSTTASLDLTGRARSRLQLLAAAFTGLIAVSGPELLGDVNLRTVHDPPNDAPILQLRAVTIFGDIDIHPVPVAVAAR